MYILSTGTFLNNWGSYDSCIKSAKGSNYWLVEATGQLPQGVDTTFRTGLCVPKDCTEDDIKQGLGSIFVESAQFAGMAKPELAYKNMVEF